MSDKPRRDIVRPTEFDPARTMVYPAPARAHAPAIPETLWQLSVEVVGGGPMDGLRARVPGPRLTMGRSADNDLPLSSDPMVSARHARIVREGQHYCLEDLDSRNGTFLGDQRLHERFLIGPGTTFSLGQTQVEFMPR